MSLVLLFNGVVSTPTRFYFTSVFTAPVSPAYDAGWGRTSSAVRRLLVNTKQGEAIVAGKGATLPNIAGVSDPGANALIRQYVSDTLAAQTISTSATLSSQLMMRETSNAHNIDAARCVCYVVSNDGLTVRGTLLAIGQSGTTGNEFTNQVAQRNATVITGGTAVQNSINVQAGDRLVFEIGGYSSLGGTGTPVVNCKVGDLATDLPVDDTQTTDGAGWLEISSGLEFAYTLTADTGTFALAGSATGVTAQRKITAATGTFTEAGSATGLKAQRKIVASTGAFVEAGSATGLLVQR